MQDILSPQLAMPPSSLITQASDGAKLRGMSSGAKSAGELKKVAGEFEAMFVSYLLKVMRETIEDSGLMEGGLGKDVYTELFDQEISKGIAQRGTLGISDILMKRLTAKPAQLAPNPSETIPPGAVILDEKESLKPISSLPDSTEPGIPDFQMPVQLPVISSRFGMRRDPFHHHLKFHKGIDIAAPAGTEVRAALSGDVVFAGFRPGYGNTVILQHPDGLQTRYAHLNSIEVKKGENVDSEKVLGSVGNTGHSTGPHLHFEVLRSGEQIDPMAALAE